MSCFAYHYGIRTAGVPGIFQLVGGCLELWGTASTRIPAGSIPATVSNSRELQPGEHTLRISLDVVLPESSVQSGDAAFGPGGTKVVPAFVRNFIGEPIFCSRDRESQTYN